MERWREKGKKGIEKMKRDVEFERATQLMKKRDKQRRNFISGETCVRVIAEMQTDSK